MRFIFFLTGLVILASSHAAFAGFEWIPPQQQVMQPAPQMQQAPMTAQNDAAFPAPAVTAQPLDQIEAMYQGDGAVSYAAPTSILPPRAPAMAAPQVKNLSGQGLYIDPYPLQQNNQPAAHETYGMAVEQAMIEKSGALNPLRFGAGLEASGGEMMGTNMTAYKERSAQIPRAPQGINSAGLTPMMGGEPAPLPGMAAAARTPQSINFAEAVGFGRDLPLALALSQVIPSEFSPSYAEGVDTGVSVSWEGGKPWNEVLNEMLRPANLTASVNGNVVTISPLARL